MRTPIVVALLNPANLTILALSVAAGLCSAWWLAPVGILLWLVMVVLVARNPALRISHSVHSRTPLAQRFQARFDRIERAQVSVYNALASMDPAIRKALQPVQEAVNALTDQAYSLCQRVSALENYRVVSQAKEDLESEWVRLSQQVANAADPVVQQEYNQSLSALESRLENQRQLITYLDRVDAQLVSLSNSLDGALGEVLRLQAIGAKQARKEQSRLVDSLRQEAQELGVFEASSLASLTNGQISA
ncbi:MAG: hypothetical protein AB1894_03640 [Chloroflexota bacterium]